jgi:hypothetical protein
MTAWLVSVVVLVSGVLLAAWLAWIRRASIGARLRIWLDPQYRDGRHVARRSDGRHAASGPEASGIGRAGVLAHRRPLHIRRLAPMTVRRYADEWAEIEANVEADPEGAVHDADRLITMAMLDRGFPVDDLEGRATELKARHGQVIANYLAAHAIALAAEHGPLQQEESRRALEHYGALFELLVVGGGSAERRRAG